MRYNRHEYELIEYVGEAEVAAPTRQEKPPVWERQPHMVFAVILAAAVAVGLVVLALIDLLRFV